MRAPKSSHPLPLRPCMSAECENAVHASVGKRPFERELAVLGGEGAKSHGILLDRSSTLRREKRSQIGARRDVRQAS